MDSRAADERMPRDRAARALAALCAWCRAPLRGAVGSASAVSHGLCRPCARRLARQRRATR